MTVSSGPRIAWPRDGTQPGPAGLLAAAARRVQAHRVVLTAVPRKLIVLANALVTDDRLWTPEPA